MKTSCTSQKAALEAAAEKAAAKSTLTRCFACLVPSRQDNFVLKNVRVVRQPGDGSCLFHSLSYGLGDTSASSLRREIAKFIESNPELKIAGTPFSERVRWENGTPGEGKRDSGVSVSSYAQRMAHSGWGGGIEIAACCVMRKVNIYVYERNSGRSQQPESDARVAHESILLAASRC